MTFNLEVLIGIKVYEAIYIVSPVFICFLDLVRPLCDHYSLGLLSVDDLLLFLLPGLLLFLLLGLFLFLLVSYFIIDGL